MSDRSRNKSFGQDASGFLFCLVGGFFAVSLALFLRGQEPKPGIVSVVTGPVVQLGAWIGAWPALALSLAVAALGTALFLRRAAMPSGRWLAIIAVLVLGLAFVLGAALERGGELGGLFPGLIAGLGGRVLGVVLGAALLWIAWSLVPAGRTGQATSASDALQRMTLSSRPDAGAAGGVTPAESALLVAERTPAARPTARREEPVREETIRPYTPPKTPPRPRGAESASGPRAAASRPIERAPFAPGAPAAPQARSSSAPSAPSAPLVRPLATPQAAGAPQPLLDDEPTPPPAPAWEQELEAAAPIEPVDLATPPRELEEPEEDPFAAPELPAPPVAEAPEPVETPVLSERPADAFAAARRALEAELELEDLDVDEPEPLAVEEAELAAALAEPEPAAPAAPPGPAWEQVQLFPEEKAEEPAEDSAQKSAKVELTPTFDFDAGEPRPHAHEPEPAGEDPFALEPAEPQFDLPAAAAAGAAVVPGAPEVAEPERVPAERTEVLQPAPPKPQKSRERRAKKREAPREPAPAAEPLELARDDAADLPALDDEGARWSQLVFDAGCAILEQNRVAVSMLERRFAIDFDRACRVLDVLQEAGLIGPYMGGRTRDILLTREEWLSHAPRAS